MLYMHLRPCLVLLQRTKGHRLIYLQPELEHVERMTIPAARPGEWATQRTGVLLEATQQLPEGSCASKSSNMNVWRKLVKVCES